MSETLTELTKLAAQFLGQPVSDLDPDASLEVLGLDDKFFWDELAEAAERFDWPLGEVEETMPDCRFERSELCLASLSDIAAFSPRAAAHLARFDTRVPVETLRSLAASLDAGHYVPSGQISENVHTPSKPGYVVFKGALLIAAMLALPLLIAFGPCNPVCRDCSRPPNEAFWDIGIISVPLMGALFARWFLPGLYELWSSTRRERQDAQSVLTED